MHCGPFLKTLPSLDQKIHMLSIHPYCCFATKSRSNDGTGLVLRGCLQLVFGPRIVFRSFFSPVAFQYFLGPNSSRKLSWDIIYPIASLFAVLILPADSRRHFFIFFV